MRICRSATDVVVQAPAKLNLFFEVLAKRSDGFHEIETLMCPIDLYDTLYFRDEPDGRLRLECVSAAHRDVSEGSAVIELPPESDNLVFRAVELIRREAGVTSGATVRLIKRIPTAAGLGGGSSDAAAALMAANLGWRLNRSPAQLASMAAELGSDIPFFLANSPAVCRGRGERVEPVANIGTLYFVVVRPPAGLATSAVYEACRPAVDAHPVERLLEALSQGNRRQTGRLLFNRLQGAAERLSACIEPLRQRFEQEDFVGHGMSGSGTSYFGLCRHASHARHLARRLQANGVGSVFAVRSCR
ncbi:MAG: 4-(cytidine 5'-diphospho)-2-C-methyl-D-erythritol kinase [Thermoguttaceae bacterium]